MVNRKQTTIKQRPARRGGFIAAPRNRQAERSRLRSLEELTTQEILGRLYSRHEVGIWQSLTTVVLAGAIVIAIT